MCKICILNLTTVICDQMSKDAVFAGDRLLNSFSDLRVRQGIQSKGLKNKWSRKVQSSFHMVRIYMSWMWQQTCAEPWAIVCSFCNADTQTPPTSSHHVSNVCRHNSDLPVPIQRSGIQYPDAGRWKTHTGTHTQVPLLCTSSALGGCRYAKRHYHQNKNCRGNIGQLSELKCIPGDMSFFLLSWLSSPHFPTVHAGETDFSLRFSSNYTSIFWPDAGPSCGHIENHL